MHTLGVLLKRGWHVVTEIHTVKWLLVDIIGVSLPPSILVSALVFYGEHSIAILGTVFFVVLGMSVLVFLAIIGHEPKEKGPAGNRQQLVDETSTSRPTAKSPEPDRIPLIDLRKMAASLGWDTNIRTSRTIGDLVDSLNQAAVDRLIKFWGRKYEYDLGESAKGTFPLVEIPVDHFVEGYTFNVINLFGDNAINFYITTGKLGKMMREQRGEIYQDIYADRIQLTAWLKQSRELQASIASVPNPDPYDQTLRGALEYIAASPAFGGEIDGAPDELRQAARNGVVTIYGRPYSGHLAPDGFYKPIEAIDRLHWRDFGFDVLRCIFHDDPRECKTQPDDRRSMRYDEVYVDLRVNSAEIKTKWPS